MEDITVDITRALLRLRANEEEPWKGHHVSRTNRAITIGLMIVVTSMFVLPMLAFLIYRIARAHKARQLREDAEQGEIELEQRRGQGGQGGVLGEQIN